MYCHMSPIVLKPNIVVGDLFTNIYGAITKSFLYYELFNSHQRKGTHQVPERTHLLLSCVNDNYLMMWLYLTIYIKGTVCTKILMTKIWTLPVPCVYMFRMFLESTKIISLSIYIILVFVIDKQCVSCAVWNEICIVVVFGVTAPIGPGPPHSRYSRSHTTMQHSQ